MKRRKNAIKSEVNEMWVFFCKVEKDAPVMNVVHPFAFFYSTVAIQQNENTIELIANAFLIWTHSKNVGEHLMTLWRMEVNTHMHIHKALDNLNRF